jgi:hypothetical protein
MKAAAAVVTLMVAVCVSTAAAGTMRVNNMARIQSAVQRLAAQTGVKYIEEAKKNTAGDAVSQIRAYLEKVEANIEAAKETTNTNHEQDTKATQDTLEAAEKRATERKDEANALYNTRMKNIADNLAKASATCDNTQASETEALENEVKILMDARLKQLHACDESKSKENTRIEGNLDDARKAAEKANSETDTAKAAYDQADKTATEAEAQYNDAATAFPGKKQTIDTTNEQCENKAENAFKATMKDADSVLADKQGESANELKLVEQIRTLLDSLSGKKDADAPVTEFIEVSQKVNSLAKRVGVTSDPNEAYHPETSSMHDLLDKIVDKIKATSKKATDQHALIKATAEKTRTDSIATCNSARDKATHEIETDRASKKAASIKARSASDELKAKYEAKKSVSFDANNRKNSAEAAAPGLHKDKQDRYNECVADANRMYNSGVAAVTGITDEISTQPVFRRRLLESPLEVVEPVTISRDIEPVQEKPVVPEAQPVPEQKEEAKAEYPISTEKADRMIEARKKQINSKHKGCTDAAGSTATTERGLAEDGWDQAQKTWDTEMDMAKKAHETTQALLDSGRTDKLAELDEELALLKQIRTMLATLTVGTQQATTQPVATPL